MLEFETPSRNSIQKLQLTSKVISKFYKIPQNKVLEKKSDLVNNKITLIFGVLRKSAKYSEFITEIFSEMNNPEQESATNQCAWNDETSNVPDWLEDITLIDEEDVMLFHMFLMYVKILMLSCLMILQ